MKNYVLASLYGHPDVIPDSLWYAMQESDLATLKAEENLKFGDKVYVIKTQKLFVMGNDDTFYEM